MPLGIPTFVSNLFSGLTKNNSSGEVAMETGEQMEVDPVVEAGADATPATNNIVVAEEIVKEEGGEALASSTIMESEQSAPSPEVTGDTECYPTEVVAATPTSSLSSDIIASGAANVDIIGEEIKTIEEVDNDQLVQSETELDEAALEAMESAETEVESATEQDDNTTTMGGTTDMEEKETGEESNLGMEDFADENDTENFVEITRRRVSQDRDGNCYCGKERNLNIAELLCASCNRWYHESCIGYQLGKLVPFMMTYVFICKNCSHTGLESYKRNQAQFSQMCVTALANLTQASIKDGTNRKVFSKDKDIIPFIDMHWEGMTTTTRRVTQSWHLTVAKALQKEVGSIFTFDEPPGDPDSPYFGLTSTDLTQIRPNYDAMIKVGNLKVTELGVHQSTNVSLRGRGAKRRIRNDDGGNGNQASVAKKSRGDSFLAKPILGHGYPVDHPYNKDGYRYILAEPDPNAPFRQEFDESSEWSGKPIPGWLYRVLNPCSVLLALHDRAPQLRVGDDRLSVTGEKGYCMIRATHGVTRGSWYWEAKITEQPEGSHSRIGWSQPHANLQGPLGYDRYGYSWRSRMGTKFHQAVGKSYCKGGYAEGDVLGFLIMLPDTNEKTPSVPPSYKDKPLVRFKSHLYYEHKDDKSHETDTSIRPGSKIICFKNGQYVGVAFEDIYEGIYYPAVSLYKPCTVAVNFGPDFWAEPDKTQYPHRGMHERAEESIIEQTTSDLLFLTDHHGKLRLDSSVILTE